MQLLKIIALCIAAACAYGILQDQVTVRVCLEYFSVWHPRIFATESPTLLALGWGIVATWWVGGILGVGLALCARAGGPPRLGAEELLRPVGRLMAVVGTVALVAGIAGYGLARAGLLVLRDPAARYIPAASHACFLADLWAHTAAYLAGFLGGIVLWVWTVRRRKALRGSF
jgi:hypothetical protein